MFAPRLFLQFHYVNNDDLLNLVTWWCFHSVCFCDYVCHEVCAKDLTKQEWDHTQKRAGVNINFNFNFKRLYSTQIYKGKAKTCVLHSNVWRLLLRYMHTACIRATKKIIDWMTFILHTITYDQRNQTSYTDAQNLSQWRTVWIMGHEWFDVMRKYKGSGKSNSVQYKIYKPIYRLYEIAGACYWAKLSR